MKSGALILVLILIGSPRAATPQQESDEREIAEAVSALPEPLRRSATVRAFRDGDLVTIREGTGVMICLGDDPAGDGWHVACYHEALEPFMARGRELRAQGVTARAEIDAARMADIESGRLDFPDHPASLYSLSGDMDAFDPATGEAKGAGGLLVIYVPYATEETIGITVVSSRERPWLMFPGKPWAHVMIAR